MKKHRNQRDFFVNSIWLTGITPDWEITRFLAVLCNFWWKQEIQSPDFLTFCELRASFWISVYKTMLTGKWRKEQGRVCVCVCWENWVEISLLLFLTVFCTLVKWRIICVCYPDKALLNFPDNVRNSLKWNKTENLNPWKFIQRYWEIKLIVPDLWITAHNSHYKMAQI